MRPSRCRPFGPCTDKVFCAGNIPTPWAGICKRCPCIQGSPASFPCTDFGLSFADSASKAALHSATETLRMEVAGFGVDVMLVAPGAITSQFGKKQTLSIKMPEGDPGLPRPRGALPRELRSGNQS